MSKTTDKPSAGALAAAEMIFAVTDDGAIGRVVEAGEQSEFVALLARIIDRETRPAQDASRKAERRYHETQRDALERGLRGQLDRLAEALVRIAITKTDWAGNYAAFGAWAEAVAVNALKDAGMYEAALREAGGE